MIASRREILSHSAKVAALMLASGLFAQTAQAAGPAAAKGAFDAKSLADLVKALGYGAPVESKDVSITAPDIAENGAVVPLAASTTLAGVKQIMLLVEKNPTVLAALFNLTPDIESALSTRVKMGQSSNVYAVAVMQDNKVFFALKEVKVTLGGCGG
jgi:sulfur-oxidizing protein SoxY